MVVVEFRDDAQILVYSIIDQRVCLVSRSTAEFNRLKDKLKTTDGTLSVHLRKLEEAGYIAIEKTFRDRRPLTRGTITRSGRAAFARYLKALGDLTGLGS